MADFKSRDTIDKNAKIWTKNLPITTKGHKRNLPRIEHFKDYVRLPSNKDVLGCYHTLLDNEKSKQKRIKIIHEELINLWKKMSFPILSEQAIIARIKKLIGEYERNQRYPKQEFKKTLNSVFDITKTEGQWLCQEDKKLYEKQIESEGKIGYTTHKPAPISSIHPSKRKRLTTKITITVPKDDIDDISSTSTSDSDTSSNVSVYECPPKAKKKYCTSVATSLVTDLSLSTNKASKVCLALAQEGINLPTPSQSGIFRRMIKCGEDLTLKIKNLLAKGKDYCLHFDGKRLPTGKGNIKQQEEYQVVFLQSPTKEIKLGVIRCESGSAENIFKGIRTIIDDYDAWSSIKMIICDTTVVNTGHKNGVVVRIQQKMLQMGLNMPQYIGCQHHVLDRILKHVLDFYLNKHTTGPNLNYTFIDEITEGYEVLKESYTPEVEMLVVENPGWRDDFRFLYILCLAFRQYKENRKLPKIIWQSLPSIHSARWNSRAIYSLIAYFLLPNWREILETPVTFIAFGWQEVWFSNQRFNNEIYDKFLSNIKETKCRTAEKCFKTHWSKENSVIDIPRSNIIAERGIKLMEELSKTCKTDKYLNIKFVSKNNF